MGLGVVAGGLLLGTELVAEGSVALVGPVSMVTVVGLVSMVAVVGLVSMVAVVGLVSLAVVVVGVAVVSSQVTE